MRRKIHKAGAALLLLAFITAAAGLMKTDADAAIYRFGSTGTTVKKIQQVLKNTGHYSYYIDGIYGSRTVKAVKSFQRSCGLSVDGICGPITLKYLGLGSSTTASSSQSSSDKMLLARIIAAEARGEPYKGQVAVGAVVLNRVKHSSFPNTIAGVIYQKGAFTAIDDGQFNSTSVPESCIRAAADAMNGWDPTGGCIYYFNPATATSSWIWSRPQIITIGKHIFCV